MFIKQALQQHWRRWLPKGGVALALCALDWGVKVWVRSEVPFNSTASLIPNLIALTHVNNYGISFSMLSDLPEGIRTPLLTGVAVVVMLVVSGVWWVGRAEMHSLQHWGFVLVLAGALSNVLNRLQFGYVTDYFYFHFYSYSFFVNNLADIFISLGLVGYVVGSFLQPTQQRPRS